VFAWLFYTAISRISPHLASASLRGDWHSLPRRAGRAKAAGRAPPLQASACRANENDLPALREWAFCARFSIGVSKRVPRIASFCVQMFERLFHRRWRRRAETPRLRVWPAIRFCGGMRRALSFATALPALPAWPRRRAALILRGGVRLRPISPRFPLRVAVYGRAAAAGPCNAAFWRHHFATGQKICSISATLFAKRTNRLDTRRTLHHRAG